MGKGMEIMAGVLRILMRSLILPDEDDAGWLWSPVMDCALLERVLRLLVVGFLLFCSIFKGEFGDF